MQENHFSISTAIDYPSGKPHLGHLYEKITADCLARWHRLLGEEVHFCTGTDEHGSKIAKYAAAQNKTPKEYVDVMTGQFVALCKKMKLSHDDFIRTTEVRHEIAVRHLMQTIYDKGDIYKGTYDGLYCIDCETFYVENKLVDGCCPVHEKPVEVVKEETYFFAMSKYQEKVKHYIQTHPDSVRPEHKRKEILARLEEPVRDLSISRKTVEWGITCPWDESHTVYVWGDALTNYLTSIGYPDARYEKFWPMLHIIGKDILWHHTMILFSLFLAADVTLPQIFSHGFITTASGAKMSKSKGTVIDPMEILNSYDVDAVRYYLLKDVVYGQDGSFSVEGLVARLNNELADQLGNLLQRVCVMADKYCERKISVAEVDSALAKKVPLHAVKDHMEAFELHRALQAVMGFVSELNVYVDSHKPWKIAKESPERLAYVLYNLREGLRCAAILLSPFIPQAAETVCDRLGVPLGKLSDCSFGFDESLISNGGVLFLKHEVTPVAEENQTKEVNYVSYEDFAKLDIRIGTISSVEDHPNADKLYVILVDFDSSEQRQIVAGIKKDYSKEELLGKQISVICNLKPAVLRGVASAGMLLAAVGSDDSSTLLCPEKKVSNNSRVH